jgi:hypothetical protein
VGTEEMGRVAMSIKCTVIKFSNNQSVHFDQELTHRNVCTRGNSEVYRETRRSRKYQHRTREVPIPVIQREARMKGIRGPQKCQRWPRDTCEDYVLRA